MMAAGAAPVVESMNTALQNYQSREASCLSGSFESSLASQSQISLADLWPKSIQKAGHAVVENSEADLSATRQDIDNEVPIADGSGKQETAAIEASDFLSP